MDANRRMHFPIRPNPLIAIVGVQQPNDSFTFCLGFDGLQFIDLADDALNLFFDKTIDEFLYEFFTQLCNTSLTIRKNEKFLIILKVISNLNNLNNNIFRRKMNNTHLIELDDYNIIVAENLISSR